VRLEGSCHCGAVQFAAESKTPYPYMRCYCSICRKTQGGGGYAINLGADAGTLEVEGEEHVSVYQAVIDGVQSPGERRFCSKCGSALWVFDPRWPELVHPFASAVDTPLPRTPETVHIMLAYAPDWVDVPPADAANVHYREYPGASIEDWHRAQGLLEED